MFHAIITFKPDSHGLRAKTRKFDLEYDPQLNDNYDQLCKTLDIAYWEGTPAPIKASFGENLPMTITSLIALS